jgi:hypothetical protein
MFTNIRNHPNILFLANFAGFVCVLLKEQTDANVNKEGEQNEVVDNEGAVMKEKEEADPTDEDFQDVYFNKKQPAVATVRTAPGKSPSTATVSCIY